MRLEAALKHFSPQGLTMTDTSTCTSADRVTSTDVMAALGMTESKAEFGMAVFLAKNGISEEERARSIGFLTQHAHAAVHKLVAKAAGEQLGACLHILAELAFEEYCRSAATEHECQHCEGKGLVEERKFVMNKMAKVHDTVASFARGDLPASIQEMPGREMRVKHDYYEITRRTCQACNGKGLIANRCRCNGTGKVLDREATKAIGAPVIKECERCSGRGFARVPSTVAHEAISSILPDLHERTWRRNWKPFYESLVTKCEIEEGIAAAEFSKVTR